MKLMKEEFSGTKHQAIHVAPEGGNIFAQKTGTFEPIEGGATYDPQKGLDEACIGMDEKNWFRRVIAAYTKFQGADWGIILVIGSSDIQTGIECVDGVARECHLKVKKFSFPTIILSHNHRRVKESRTQREISILDYAFANFTDQQAVTLFFDNDALFEYLLMRNQESPSEAFVEFVQQIRAFKGLLFLVTKPLWKRYLPIEFPHYIEIQHPSEEQQIRQWESHFQDGRCDEWEVSDLVKNNPMHLKEIDYFAHQAKIDAILNEAEAPLSLIQIYKMIGRLGKKKKTRALFGGGKIEKGNGGAGDDYLKQPYLDRI